MKNRAYMFLQEEGSHDSSPKAGRVTYNFDESRRLIDEIANIVYDSKAESSSGVDLTQLPSEDTQKDTDSSLNAMQVSHCEAYTSPLTLCTLSAHVKNTGNFILW